MITEEQKRALSREALQALQETIRRAEAFIIRFPTRQSWTSYCVENQLYTENQQAHWLKKNGYNPFDSYKYY